MRVRWAPAAGDDLHVIHDYVREHYPTRVQQTVRKLYDAACSLTEFPNRGRIGKVPGTRELVISSLP